jgi:hypothetical protein
MHPIYRPIKTDSRLGPASPDASLILDIMSFNIRRGTAKDGRNHWSFRRNPVHEIQDRYRPDVLGLLGARIFKLPRSTGCSLVTRWWALAVWGGSKGMHTAIFFNAARFSLSDEGTLSLSHCFLFNNFVGPHKPSRHLFHKGKRDIGKVFQNRLKLFFRKHHEISFFHRLHVH